ncbi:MAG: archease [Actinomycetota bacterium]|nr:archease [Actinomycetota bacterium]
MYRWVDHTSELGLEIDAPAEADVYVDAAAALAEVVGEKPRGGFERREIALEGDDRAALLADWLAELVFLAETDDFVPERVSALSLRDDGLRATVEGRRGEPRHLVKAVTYHRLEFADVDGRWRAHVVLDV